MEKRTLQTTAAALAIISVIAIAAFGALRYNSRPSAKPATWADAIDKTKPAVVLVRSADGMASGFLLSADGLVATTSSIIGKSATVEVRLSTGALKKATVTKSGIGLLDIALLKIEEPQTQILPVIAGPDECRDGQEIRVIGAPQGVDYFVRKAIISHCNNDRDGVRYLQTDMPFDAGSIGAPCIDKKGSVIGLYSSYSSGEAQVLAQVLPLSLVKEFGDGKLVSLENALNDREVERAKELERGRALAGDQEQITRRLQEYADAERKRYLQNLDGLHRSGSITYEQGKLMVEQIQYGPSGSEPLADWVRTISRRVVRGKLTEADAQKIIQQHFKRK